MGILRTTTLAIGAALIGSVPGVLVVKPGILPWVLLSIGILFLLHGTGFLDEYALRKMLRCFREKWPAIAIIGDLPWAPDAAEKRTHIWAWPAMNPSVWYSRIIEEAKQSNLKVAVDLIQIKRPWTRLFLDRYNAVLNPYGSVYPEIDIKQVSVLNTILDYVLSGGLFINVADIPFYWAYDPEREVLYDLVKYTHQYVPFEYESNDCVLRLKSGHIKSFGPFPETPFLTELKINVINTETIINRKIEPNYSTLKVKEQSFHVKDLDSVAINRAVVVEKTSEYGSSLSVQTGRVQSIVEEIDRNGQALTPICYVNFGKGRFLVSLVFLDYEKQSEESKSQITALQCKLIFHELAEKRSKRGGKSMKDRAKNFLRNFFVGLSYGLVIMFATAIVLYIIKSDFGKSGSPVGFELATISSILGGFALASGFLDRAPTRLKTKLRRIGVAFLVATIAFAVYQICFPSIEYTVAQYVTAAGISVGAVSFAIGTFLLARVISGLWSQPEEPTSEMS